MVRELFGTMRTPKDATSVRSSTIQHVPVRSSTIQYAPVRIRTETVHPSVRLPASAATLCT